MKNLLFCCLVLFLSCGWLQFCTSAREETAKTDQLQKLPAVPPGENLAPGSVKVSAVLLDHEKQESGYLCKMKIVKVLGYGMGARPVPKGSEIMVRVADEKVSDNDTLASKIKMDGESFIMTLKSANQKHESGVNKPVWKVMRIK